jgi:nucleotide-binding universal stress UspA family protein
MCGHRYKPSLVDRAAAATASKLALDASVAATIFGEEASQCTAGSCWLEAAGDVVKNVNRAARHADLVILGQYEWQGTPENHPLPIAHSVVLRCGRPVLVVPAAIEPRAPARIAVAWDGSREAVRAVHDALPLLRLSRAVQIVTMTRSAATVEEIAVDAKALSDHLANHDIKVETNILKIGGVDEHEALAKQIKEGQFDLLVMGGYSHPMWLQFIFGGATQSMLLSSKIPVFVSH